MTKTDSAVLEPHKLYIAVHLTHPPLQQRTTAIERQLQSQTTERVELVSINKDVSSNQVAANNQKTDENPDEKSGQDPNSTPGKGQSDQLSPDLENQKSKE